MGRRKITAGPLDVAYVVERFALRDGPRWRWSTAIDPAGEFGRSHAFARLRSPAFSFSWLTASH
jgi:hypothetical protein